MSKYQQIDIQILPFFEKRFSDQFPHTADLLQQTGHAEAVEREVSLYALVDHMVSINRDPQVSEDIKARIGGHIRHLLDLKRTAREYLLSQQLHKLDQVLYEIDDRFEELEGAL
jgi:hypothetical protein